MYEIKGFVMEEGMVNNLNLDSNFDWLLIKVPKEVKFAETQKTVNMEIDCNGRLVEIMEDI